MHFAKNIRLYVNILNKNYQQKIALMLYRYDRFMIYVINTARYISRAFYRVKACILTPSSIIYIYDSLDAFLWKY